MNITWLKSRCRHDTVRSIVAVGSVCYNHHATKLCHGLSVESASVPTREPHRGLRSTFSTATSVSPCDCPTPASFQHSQRISRQIGLPISAAWALFALENFVRWFLAVTKLKPQSVMIDCSLTEALAISKAWPNTKIRYCRWHLPQAVFSQIQKINVKAVTQSKENMLKAALSAIQLWLFAEQAQ